LIVVIFCVVTCLHELHGVVFRLFGHACSTMYYAMKTWSGGTAPQIPNLGFRWG